MKKVIPFIICFVLLPFFFYSPGLCIDGNDIVRLKENGIDGKTIQTIIKEKVIETCALTVQEILDLKKTGMKNETIRMVVENASFMKDMGPIEYARDIKSIRFTTVKDIIDLKNEGVSDNVIETIISATRSEDNKDRERAWKMLKNMGLIIDKR